MVHCAPLFSAISCSQATGIETPSPGRERAENAAAVVWPRAVPQVVDEDPADAVGAAALGDESLGDRFRQMRHDRLREALDDVVVRARARAARRRAGPCRRSSSASSRAPSSLEHRAHQQRRLLDLRPAHAFARIEVEDDAIGLVDLAASSSSRCGTRSCSSAPPRRARRRCRRRASPRARARASESSSRRPGMRVSGCFWKNSSPVDAVGRAHQRDRPVAQVRQDALGDALVVAHQRRPW